MTARETLAQIAQRLRRLYGYDEETLQASQVSIQLEVILQQLRALCAAADYIDNGTATCPCPRCSEEEEDPPWIT